MSQFENIFKITPDGGITINKEEVRGHNVLKRFVGNKKENLQDLMFIYLMGDPRSMVGHLPVEDRQIQAIKHIGRPPEWLPSPLLRGAIEEYKNLISITPTGKSFFAANKALYEAGNDINDLIDSSSYLKSLLKAKVRILESDELGIEEVIGSIKECKGLMTEIVKNQEKINSIIKDLPALIKTVEGLAKNWANEGNGVKEIYGGGELNNREG